LLHQLHSLGRQLLLQLFSFYDCLGGFGFYAIQRARKLVGSPLFRVMEGTALIWCQGMVSFFVIWPCFVAHMNHLFVGGLDPEVVAT